MHILLAQNQLIAFPKNACVLNCTYLTLELTDHRFNMIVLCRLASRTSCLLLATSFYNNFTSGIITNMIVSLESRIKLCSLWDPTSHFLRLTRLSTIRHQNLILKPVHVSSYHSLSMNQSASKHGRRTFLYSAMRELVCNGQLWARAVLRQLRSYKVG